MVRAAQRHRSHEVHGRLFRSRPTRIQHVARADATHMHQFLPMLRGGGSSGRSPRPPFTRRSADAGGSSSSSTAGGGWGMRLRWSWLKSAARRPPRSRYRSTVRASTSQMSAVASTEQPCPRHLMIRTTTSSGSFDISRRVPVRSLNRRWQVEQYSRRMERSLPIQSETLRLPAANRLKSSQSGLGQAKRSSASSAAGPPTPPAHRSATEWCSATCVRAMTGLLAQKERHAHRIRATAMSLDYKPREVVPMY
jgi:hypothetical protein